MQKGRHRLEPKTSNMLACKKKAVGQANKMEMLPVEDRRGYLNGRDR